MPKKVTWLTPFANVWREVYGGPMPVEPSVRPLQTAVESLGADEALRRFENYVSETPGNFASAARFASTLNQWAGPSRKRKGLTSSAIAVTPESLQRAKTLLDIGRRYSLLTFEGNRTQYSDALNRAAADPAAGEAFREDVKTVRLWEHIDGMDDDVAVTEIARRLAMKRPGNSVESRQELRTA